MRHVLVKNDRVSKRCKKAYKPKNPDASWGFWYNTGKKGGYMNKLIWAFVIVAVGVGVGWYYFKGSGASLSQSARVKSQTQNSSGSADQSTNAAGGNSAIAANTVSYTDSGFSPKTLTVKKGTAVAFRNDSSKKMWVASGVHPTHKLLPGFDELTSVVNGGVYTYTFVKVGTWQYHNHLNPTDVAVVVVTE